MIYWCESSQLVWCFREYSKRPKKIHKNSVQFSISNEIRFGYFSSSTIKRRICVISHFSLAVPSRIALIRVNPFSVQAHTWNIQTLSEMWLHCERFASNVCHLHEITSKSERHREKNLFLVCHSLIISFIFDSWWKQMLIFARKTE